MPVRRGRHFIRRFLALTFSGVAKVGFLEQHCRIYRKAALDEGHTRGGGGSCHPQWLHDGPQCQERSPRVLEIVGKPLGCRDSAPNPAAGAHSAPQTS